VLIGGYAMGLRWKIALLSVWSTGGTLLGG
jgi:hypothetical protein